MVHPFHYSQTCTTVCLALAACALFGLNYVNMQGIEYAWVDDPKISGPPLYRFFKDLKVVLDDLFHFLQRILREVPQGHCMKGEL